MLGEAFAARFPTRLHSLTVCSSPTYLPQAALDLFSFDHSSWPDACRELGSRGWGAHLARVPGTLLASDPKYEAWWMSQIGASSSEGFAGYAEFLSSLDTRPFLSHISVPTLIVAPAKNAATGLEEQLQIARQVKGSRLVIINGSGHEIYANKPEDCLKAFTEFLCELDS